MCRSTSQTHGQARRFPRDDPKDLGRARAARLNILVIAGEDGADWVEAALQISRERNLPLRAFTLGLKEGDYLDIRGAWMKHRDIGPQGVVIVRPDRYIAFRSLLRSTSAINSMRAAFRNILAT